MCDSPLRQARRNEQICPSDAAHSVSGGCHGNKQQDLQRCMEEIESLEGSLSEIYAERLGMSKEEVKQTYFDGDTIG